MTDVYYTQSIHCNLMVLVIRLGVNSSQITAIFITDIIKGGKWK